MIRVFRCLLGLVLTLGLNPLGAAEPLAPDVQAVVTKISARLRAGETKPEALADDLKAFDSLLTKYRTTAPEQAARIIFLKASLHAQVFQDFGTARELMKQVASEFPATETARQAEQMLASLDRMVQAKAAQAALIGKPAPDLAFTWASRPGLTSLASLKGKVVVLDFWATWCGPCVSSFPQMRELTAHYAGKEVEVIGVTSPQGYVMGLESGRIDTKGDVKKEYGLMAEYIKAKDITWTVAFSAEPVFNPAYGITGIPYMAIVAPDGTLRHTGLHPAMPHAEKVEKIDALLKELAQGGGKTR